MESADLGLLSHLWTRLFDTLRRLFNPLPLLFAMLVLSCETLDDGKDGILFIRFSPVAYSDTKSPLADVPDTSEFILEVKGPDGNIVYNGKFADSPENLIVPPGPYTISVRSAVKTAPGFSNPVYGDDQCVIVPSGGVGKVILNCLQVNCGIRLRIATDFLVSYPEGVLYLKSSEGKLMYGFSEKRIAYFNPGEISFILDNAGQPRILAKRIMKARDMLDMRISAPNKEIPDGKNKVEIIVDTSRNWTAEDFIIGGEDRMKGETKDNPYSINEARQSVGAKEKWVCGFIVGSFKSSSNLQLAKPFESATNVAIAGRRNVSDKNSCLSVELRKGKLRTDINLLENVSNLGKKLYVKGDIVEAYFGIPGIKNIKEYKLE